VGDDRAIGRRFGGAAALVVGGANGIGRATAERLAREGAAVAVADLEAEAAEAVAAALPGAGHRAIPVDVLDPDSVAAAVERAAAPTGAIDVLAHVAGGDVPHGAFETIPDELWRSMLDLNLLGPVRTARAALPLLRRSAFGASITIVSTVNASLTLGEEPYSAAKAALVPVIRNLAADLGADAIRVNAVAPGTTRTRVWDAQGGPDRFADLYPLGRVGEPADIAAAIAFLASSDAAFVTGHVLPVDGGLGIRRIPFG
jgi:meso-butanediol dehydrogenase / (S,S)-butanediol dehydrogenase / diacetyl reductase